jgi:UDPglucose 6-dehydrogenase
MRISVLGTGYLGATHAACLSALGHDVLGVDVDPGRVDALSTGRAPFREPGLDELLARGLEQGLLAFDTDPGAAARHADLHFICVGTPQQISGSGLDLSHVWDAVRAVAADLPADSLLIGKSTVPVGTANALQDYLADVGRDDVEVAWNPEFLREGHAIQDSLCPERLVFGVQSPEAELRLRKTYAPIIREGATVIRTDVSTAELAKASANAMLAARLSVVNVLAEICEAAAANVTDLIAILGSDSRIGSAYLAPGVGFGGGCLPKDLRGLVARGEELEVGSALNLLTEVDHVNQRQRARTAALALSWLDDPARSAVGVLGASFKADSDDTRDSPALDVARRLHESGVDVRVYDPMGMPQARAELPDLRYMMDAVSACDGADLTLVLTEWTEFAGLDPVALRQFVARPQVIDARHVLDREKWRAAGWRFHALGDGRA